MATGYHIRQYSSKLFSNLLKLHFFASCPNTSLPSCDTPLWILSPVPYHPSLALFNWLQVRVQHLLDFLSRLSIVTTEIWNLISLPSFTPWVNPHYVHTHRHSHKFLCVRGWHCGYVLSSLQEGSRKPPKCEIPYCCWSLWHGSPPSKQIHRNWEQLFES